MSSEDVDAAADQAYKDKEALAQREEDIKNWLAILRSPLDQLGQVIDNLPPINQDPERGYRLREDNTRARLITATIPIGEGGERSERIVTVYQSEYRDSPSESWRLDVLVISIQVWQGYSFRPEMYRIKMTPEPKFYDATSSGLFPPSKKRRKVLLQVGLGIPNNRYTKPEDALKGLSFLVNEVGRYLNHKRSIVTVSPKPERPII